MLEIDQWLTFNAHNKGHAGTTVANYRAAITALGESLKLRGIPLLRARPEHLQAFAGEELFKKGLSPASRRIAVSAIRGFYHFHHKAGRITADPSNGLPYPKMGRSLPVPIAGADAERIFAECDLETFKGVRDAALLSVLVGCGPRASGVSGLNQGDLIFTLNELRIEELTLRLREKGSKERYVPAPEETRLLLRAYLGHPELELIDRRLPSGDQVLFVNLHNSHVRMGEHRGEARRLAPWSIWQLIREYGTAAGVDPRYLHPHAFRHLYGQELAEADVDILVRQQLLGHADPKSTEIYSHIAFRKLRRAVQDANPMKRMKTPATGLASMLRGR